jgi:hypothetical protein
VIDYATAWAKLGAWVAEEPNRGRAALLQRMAELTEECRVEDDELERALRLVAPQFADVLFNRIGELSQLVREQGEGEQAEQVGEGSAPSGSPEAVRPSIAA